MVSGMYSGCDVTVTSNKVTNGLHVYMYMYSTCTCTVHVFYGPESDIGME